MREHPNGFVGSCLDPWVLPWSEDVQCLSTIVHRWAIIRCERVEV